MMLINPLGEQRVTDPALAQQVKAWVHEALHVADDTTIMVTEVRCTTPDCPPVKTVIALLERAKPARQYKIHRPLAQIGHEDIVHLATTSLQEKQAGSAVESHTKEIHL